MAHDCSRNYIWGYEFPPCRAARPWCRRDCSGPVGLRRTGGRLISMGGARSKVDFKRKGLCGIPGGRRWSRRHDVYESVLVSDRQAWPSDVSGGFHASTVATGKASGKPGNEISNVVGYWRSSGSSPCGFGQVADNVSYSSTAQVTSGAHRNGHLNPCDRGAPGPRWLLRGNPCRVVIVASEALLAALRGGSVHRTHRDARSGAGPFRSVGRDSVETRAGR
jgi:hypothetical protein